MYTKGLGDIFEYLSEKQGVLQERLCSGVCTSISYKRFEKGIQDMDFFAIERLMSRLGRPLNVLHAVLDFEESIIYNLQVKIENLILDGALSEAEKLLKEYSRRIDGRAAVCRSNINIQYYKKMCAVIMDEKSCVPVCGIDEINNMLWLTLPGFAIERLDDYLLAEEEVNLLLMWIEQKIYQGDPDSFCVLKKIKRYLDRRDLSSEIYLRIYPKLGWLYLKNPCVSAEKKLEICEQIINLLVSNGYLYYLPQLLEKEVEILEHISADYMTKLKQCKSQREALKWVYETAGLKYPAGSIRMWQTLNKSDFIMLSDIVRMERGRLGKSQGAFAEYIGVDVKTISRLETGQYLPKQGTLKKLAEALGWSGRLYNRKLISDNFSLQDVKSDMERQILFSRYEAAEAVFEQLRKFLSLDYEINRQYIMYMQTIFGLHKKTLNLGAALEKLIEAFEITHPFNIDMLSNYILNDYECYIVNLIAEMNYCQGKKSRAIEILENILTVYDKSRFDESCHYKQLLITLNTLGCLCLANGKFEKAIIYSIRGLRLKIKIGGFYTVVNFAVMIANIEKEIGSQKENILCNNKIIINYPKIFACYYSFEINESMSRIYDVTLKYGINWIRFFPRTLIIIMQELGICVIDIMGWNDEKMIEKSICSIINSKNQFNQEEIRKIYEYEIGRYTDFKSGYYHDRYLKMNIYNFVKIYGQQSIFVEQTKDGREISFLNFEAEIRKNMKE